MHQFTVPQFIEVEAKIIGPISVRQFVILLVGGLFAFIFYKIADFTLFVFLAVVDLAISGTLAFFKVNGMPFHFFILNLVQTLKKPTLRVWQKEVSISEIKKRLKQEEKGEAPPPIPLKAPIKASRLSELSLVVDTGGAYQPET